MSQCRNEERDKGSNRAGHMGTRGTIYVTLEETVHRNIPLSGELKPICRVPPVGVEVPICETGDFGEGTKNILKYDEEDEEEGDHKRE